jgi:hypothetical protein
VSVAGSRCKTFIIVRAEIVVVGTGFHLTQLGAQGDGTGGPPRTLPALPLQRPPRDKWEVRIAAITGRTLLNSNAAVEKHLGVPDTKRNWNAIATVGKVLSS